MTEHLKYIKLYGQNGNSDEDDDGILEVTAAEYTEIIDEINLQEPNSLVFPPFVVGKIGWVHGVEIHGIEA